MIWSLPTSARLDLMDSEGTRVGQLTLAPLPGSQGVIRDRTGDPSLPEFVPQIELFEASEYHFVIETDLQVVRCEPTELFGPDTAANKSGRFRTRENVGEVQLEFVLSDSTSKRETRATARLDVSPSKVGDQEAFHSMLTDLADQAVEVLHEGFAPSAGRFGSDIGPDPRLIYQQFAMLHARLFAPELDWALRRIVAEPYLSWVDVIERRPPGSPSKGSSRLSRAITKPGPRVVAVRAVPPLTSWPAMPEAERAEPSRDNVPNRYVRFVLERWRDLAIETHRLLTEKKVKAGGPLNRGLRETRRTIDHLEELLTAPVFRAAGVLRSFPAGNQVLTKREGYRQVVRAAALIESNLGLDLDLEEPFVVSRRNIATLYEYWCFARLARSLADACSRPNDANLFELASNGMSLRLKQGEAARWSFETVVDGQSIAVELFFNKTFSSGGEAAASWTRRMRPDTSVRIVPLRAYRGSPAEHWVHFDAKYRIGRPLDAAVGFEDGGSESGANRDDLLKMHAYRDAIRGSAAAYVLYPGGKETRFQYGTEFLPALGAFPLRPERIESDGRQLEQLFRGVLRHAANESTQHERAEFWARRSYSGPGATRPTSQPPGFDTPPADLGVLLGYVKNSRHRHWIETGGQYNFRAGERRGSMSRRAVDLQAELLVLYGGSSWQGPPVAYRRVSGWDAVDLETLEARGYANAGGPAYFLCSIERMEFQAAWLDVAVASLVPGSRPNSGLPISTTWLDLAKAAELSDVG